MIRTRRIRSLSQRLSAHPYCLQLLCPFRNFSLNALQLAIECRWDLIEVLQRIFDSRKGMGKLRESMRSRSLIATANWAAGRGVLRQPLGNLQPTTLNLQGTGIGSRAFANTIH